MKHYLISADDLHDLMKRLSKDADIFEEYETLHLAKRTPEGTEKAAANRFHADGIREVLSRVSKNVIGRQFKFHCDTVERLIDASYDAGHNPVAIVVSRAFLKGWHEEISGMYPLQPDSHYLDLNGGSWTGLTIYLAKDASVTGVVVVGPDSEVYAKAQAAYA